LVTQPQGQSAEQPPLNRCSADLRVGVVRTARRGTANAPGRL
jgi:hypothetical protein